MSLSKCDKLVEEFFKCRKENGLSGVIYGKCNVLLREMNACFDTEVRAHADFRAIIIFTVVGLQEEVKSQSRLPKMKHVFICSVKSVNLYL